MDNKDIIYVIYRDGKIYHGLNGRKGAYLEIGSAKRIITSDSKHLAEDMYNSYKINNNIGTYFHELNKSKKEVWIQKARDRFEIKEFVEKEC